MSLGQFLEFSVRTPDILESLAFYKALGFTELESGDIWSHKYVVVSDGILNIGLHDREFSAPAVTFVHHDVAKTARAMTAWPILNSSMVSRAAMRLVFW